MTSILTVHEKWPGLKQGFELKRQRTTSRGTTEEVVYGITSFSLERAEASRLLELVRRHWQIENGLHSVRDVTLGEDRCRVRKGSAPQILAGLRNAVVHLLSTVEAESRPAAIEQLAVNPNQALQLLGAEPFQ